MIFAMNHCSLKAMMGVFFVVILSLVSSPVWGADGARDDGAVDDEVMYDAQGFYMGGFAGYVLGDDNAISNDGVNGGGFVGYGRWIPLVSEDDVYTALEFRLSHFDMSYRDGTTVTPLHVRYGGSMVLRVGRVAHFHEPFLYYVTLGGGRLSLARDGKKLNHDGFVWGVGLRLPLRDRLYVRGEYQYLDGGTFLGYDVDAFHSFNFGVLAQF